jgi:coenzyme F420-reducing hydrogenase gamma subunit
MYMDTYSDDRSQGPLQGPLETLIFKQLSALLTGEKMLEERYQSLDEANPLESSKFETEVLALHQRADRLQRMIEAMGCGTCSEFGYDGGPLAA